MHTDRPPRTGRKGEAGRRRRGPGLLLLLLLGSWQTALAADFVCPTAGDVACLLEAITTANANGAANTLTVGAGTYTLRTIHPGTEDDPTGLPVIRSPLSIRGAGAEATIIERDPRAPLFRLLKVAAPGTLTLTGLTLRGGDTPGSGGGLANTGGIVTLTHCVLTHNTARDRSDVAGGGGLANLADGDGAIGTVTLTQCTLAHNTAHGSGGGLFNAYSPFSTSTVTLTDCLVTANTARNGGGLFNLADIYTARMVLTHATLTANTATDGGGGIHNHGSLTLTSATLAHNTASSGGGIANGYYGTLTLTESTLTANTARGHDVFADGGGIANSGTLTLTDSTLSANTASGRGGGLATSDPGFGGWTATLTNCSLASNTARSGGGIANSDNGTLSLTASTLTANTATERGGGIANSDNGTLSLTASTLTANTATERGGGIFNEHAFLTLTNTTLSTNTAHRGGGLFNNGLLTLASSTLAHNTARGSGGGLANDGDSGAATVQHTILALNTAPAAAPHGEDCLGDLTSLGTNLLGNATGCTLTRPQGGRDLTGAPGLGAFTDDGTPGHGHFPLLPTSQAINAGQDAACPDTDQLGHPRLGPCDIGAIEFHPRDTTPPTILVTATPEPRRSPHRTRALVTIAGKVRDAGSGVDLDTATYAVTDEYGRVEPRGAVDVDADGRYAFTIKLRATRKGHDQDGRQYSIRVAAHDLAGNEGSETTGVTVPHEQGQEHGCGLRRRPRHGHLW